MEVRATGAVDTGSCVLLSVTQYLAGRLGWNKLFPAVSNRLGFPRSLPRT